MKRNKVLAVIGLLAILSVLLSTVGYAQTPAPADNPLKGQKIEMAILGIGGWPPSRLGVDMSPDFAKYAKEKYGYDVTFTFQEAPFGDLFQKAAASLATKSQEYNIIISDSQWLGALAEPGWIVKLEDVIKANPGLDVEWIDPEVKLTYQIYPDGSEVRWGLPEEGDVVVLYVRKDLMSDAKEREAFKAKYGMDLPQTYEDWQNVTMEDFEKIAEFFTRPDKGMWGMAMQYSKVYDFMTMYLYPFMFSQGGEISGSEDRPDPRYPQQRRQRQSHGAEPQHAQVHAAWGHQLRHLRGDGCLYAG